MHILKLMLRFGFVGVLLIMFLYPQGKTGLIASTSPLVEPVHTHEQTPATQPNPESISEEVPMV